MLNIFKRRKDNYQLPTILPGPSVTAIIELTKLVERKIEARKRKDARALIVKRRLMKRGK